jgi:hypothetical protein
MRKVFVRHADTLAATAMRKLRCVAVVAVDLVSVFFTSCRKVTM